MYNHFVCQLTNTRLMDANKKYKKHLDDIDKQHKFIISAYTSWRNYETEMNRSMILENLHHIYESLCVTKGIKASKPYRKRKPIDFTNKKIKLCQDCVGSFCLRNTCAELFCVKCGRIELIDGTAFYFQQTKNNKKVKTRKYTFKYALNKFINENENILTPLTLSQERINTVNTIFEQIEYDLPEKISYQFTIYKILSIIIPKGPQRVWVNMAYLFTSFTRRWEYEWKWNASLRNKGIVF